MPEATDPTPDPTEALRQQLATANTRLVQAELKAHAVREGIIDLDCLKMLDQSALALDEQGNVPEAKTAVATLKREKPWMFSSPSSSHPAPAPKADPPKTRLAQEMTHREWQVARERLIKGR